MEDLLLKEYEEGGTANLSGSRSRVNFRRCHNLENIGFLPLSMQLHTASIHVKIFKSLAARSKEDKYSL